MVNDLYKIDNIFTEYQREKLIEDSKPLFLDGAKFAATIPIIMALSAAITISMNII